MIIGKSDAGIAPPPPPCRRNVKHRTSEDAFLRWFSTTANILYVNFLTGCGSCILTDNSIYSVSPTWLWAKYKIPLP